MRILIASDLYWPNINGVATFGRNLAKGLAAAGHEVVVVAPSQTGKGYEETDGNYRIMRTMSLEFPFYQNLRVSLSPTREIKRMVSDFKPDIIHVQTPLGIGLGAVSAAKKFHIPLIATNHAMSENLIENLKLLSPFAKQIDVILRQYGFRFYNNADYVTLPTTAAITMLGSRPAKRSYIAISNGIDLSRFQPGEVPPEVYKRYDIPNDTPIIMYLGRLDAEKHVSVLIRAAGALGSRPYQVVIVGFGNDVDRLKGLTRDLGLSKRVTFTGRIDEEDKAPLLRAASVFVMPSPAELQSIATLEAIASGLPVVAVQAGALHELCEDGYNGFTFPVDDDQVLAHNLSQILDDPTMRSRMARASLEVARRHDITTTIHEFEDLYQRALVEHEATEPKQLTMPGAGTH